MRESVHPRYSYQRFLLRKLQYTQQYDELYECRLSTMSERLSERLRLKRSTGSPYISKVTSTPGTKETVNLSPTCILELQPNTESVIIGIIYKKMKNYTGFLHEYQKELMRINIGSPAEQDDNGEGLGIDQLDVATPPQNNEQLYESASLTGKSQNLSIMPFKKIISEEDYLTIEDQSGSVVIGDVNVPFFCTGVVIAAKGVLNEKGIFKVNALYFPGCNPAPLRIVANSLSHKPCYIAITSGLNIGPDGTATASLSALYSFLVGNRTHVMDNGIEISPKSIARLVIAGNLVAPTYEYSLQSKVRLDPDDHKQIEAIGEISTAANTMKGADAFLSALAESIFIDLIPGEYDPTCVFWPQQPIHPVLLPESSKKPSLKLVTNPFEVSYAPSSSEREEVETKQLDDEKPSQYTSFFITSGANVADMLKQSGHTSVISVLSSLLDIGTSCPTAPNTLTCYPFSSANNNGYDVFSFKETPHVLICGNCEKFETSLLNGTCSETLDSNNQNCSGASRLIAVPALCNSGELVLIDIASPNMDTIAVKLDF